MLGWIVLGADCLVVSMDKMTAAYGRLYLKVRFDDCSVDNAVPFGCGLGGLIIVL